jgi:hypothetical protein
MQKWTQEEEYKMTKMIKDGSSIDDIAKEHNRNPQEIEMRLRKIIYENVISGKDFKSISMALNLPEDDVVKYYNLYKEFKNNYQEPKHNIPNPNSSHSGLNLTEKRIESKINKLERENKFIKLMLENKELHSKLNEQIKNNKIDKSVKDIIKQMRKY